jgi:Na+/H+ antiporter NhaD/arsenite permease-like protein
MGANTYIGNAPNLMVKSIAEARGVRMPSFFAYFGWSVLVLGPIYLLLVLLFFH